MKKAYNTTLHSIGHARQYQYHRHLAQVHVREGQIGSKRCVAKAPVIGFASGALLHADTASFGYTLALISKCRLTSRTYTVLLALSS